MITRSSAPPWAKRRGRQITRTFGRYTAGLRMEPDFLMCGANRSGTTALWRALITHPLVVPAAFHKGVGYFDLNYTRGPDWYRGHFPIRAVARRRTREGAQPPLAMEASGYYLDHPAAVHRIAQDLPGVRVIVMLRDPVERAHSAHRNAFNRGLETLGFDEAIEAERGRNAGELERLEADPAYQSVEHRHHSYVRRGQYVDRLELFFDLLGRHRVHVLFSERFAEHPEPEYDRVLDFLGLPAHRPPGGFGRWNAAPPAEMSPRARRVLTEHYAPYDDRLEALLGEPLPWRHAVGPETASPSVG